MLGARGIGPRGVITIGIIDPGGGASIIGGPIIRGYGTIPGCGIIPSVK